MMLLVAWAVWNGDDNARLGDVIHRLDGRDLAVLGRLLVAMASGGPAIDAWITTMETEPRR